MATGVSARKSWVNADSAATQRGEVLLMVGRIMIGWIFVRYGWEQMMDIAAFANTLPRRGIPALMGYIAAPIDFFGGLALVLGLGTRFVAPVMLVFTIVATFSSHAFWTYPVEQMRNQETHFWRNVTLMGGLILLFVHGGGRYALDRLLVRKDS